MNRLQYAYINIIIAEQVNSVKFKILLYNFFIPLTSFFFQEKFFFLFLSHLSLLFLLTISCLLLFLGKGNKIVVIF